MKIRIAIAAAKNGEWVAAGSGWVSSSTSESLVLEQMDEHKAYDVATFWVEADIPLPPGRGTEILGSVKGAS